MKFLKATPLFAPVELSNIYIPYREKYNVLREQDDSKVQIGELEQRFAKELMSKTLDNIQIQLEPHESLWIMMHGDWAIDISKHTGETVFNLSGFIKLIGGLPKFTYFVVMDDKRTGAITLRMYPNRLGLKVIYKSEEYEPSTDLEFKI